jgi:hypothetical protein
MRSKIKFLFAPEGDPDGGGGASHEDAAASLFSSDGTPPQAGDVTPPQDAKPKADAPAPDLKPKGDTAPDPKPKGIFDIFDKDKKALADEKPKADAPAATDHPEDKLDLSESTKPETRTQFADLKNITKGLRTEVSTKATENETLRRQVEELRTKGSDPAELTALKTERDAMSQRLSQLDLQNHPEFKKTFGEPKAQLMESIKESLTNSEAGDVDVAAMLKLTGPAFSKAVSEAAEELSDFDKPAFMSDMRQLQKLSMAEKNALDKSGDLSKEFAVKAEQSSRQAFEKVWTEIGGMDQFLVKLDVADSMSAEEKSSVDAYNQSVGGVKAEAEKIAFAATDDTGVSRIATEAATFRFLVKEAFPRMESGYRESQKLVSALQAEIKALKGSQPKGGDNGGDRHGGVPNSQDHESAAASIWPQ